MKRVTTAGDDGRGEYPLMPQKRRNTRQSERKARNVFRGTPSAYGLLRRSGELFSKREDLLGRERGTARHPFDGSRYRQPEFSRVDFHAQLGTTGGSRVLTGLGFIADQSI